jgi:phage-related protein
VSKAGKPLVWLKGEVKTPPFTSNARMEAGILLRRLQHGEMIGLPQSRPMPSIGKRCHELRITDETVTWRIIYRIDPDAVIIGEVFAKKTTTTPKHVIEVCKHRYKQYDQAIK